MSAAGAVKQHRSYLIHSNHTYVHTNEERPAYHGMGVCVHARIHCIHRHTSVIKFTAMPEPRTISLSSIMAALQSLTLTATSASSSFAYTQTKQPMHLPNIDRHSKMCGVSQSVTHATFFGWTAVTVWCFLMQLNLGSTYVVNGDVNVNDINGKTRENLSLTPSSMVTSCAPVIPLPPTMSRRVKGYGPYSWQLAQWHLYRCTHTESLKPTHVFETHLQSPLNSFNW